MKAMPYKISFGLNQLFESSRSLVAREKCCVNATCLNGILYEEDLSCHCFSTLRWLAQICMTEIYSITAHHSQQKPGTLYYKVAVILK